MQLSDTDSKQHTTHTHTHTTTHKTRTDEGDTQSKHILYETLAQCLFAVALKKCQEQKQGQEVNHVIVLELKKLLQSVKQSKVHRPRDHHKKLCYITLKMG